MSKYASLHTAAGQKAKDKYLLNLNTVKVFVFLTVLFQCHIIILLVN
jgi:hypothetical protein